MRIPLPSQSSSPSRFPLPASGSHLAACCQVIMLGTQRYVWDGEERTRQQIRLAFELNDEMRQDGQPFILGRIYTYSMHQNAHFRADLESWLGRSLDPSEVRSFDLADMVGCAAVIGVSHDTAQNGNTYANITGIMKPPPGSPARLPLLTEAIVLSPLEFNPRAFSQLPDFLRQKCLDAPEYQAVVGNRPILPSQQSLRLPQPASRRPLGRQEDDLDGDSIPF